MTKTLTEKQSAFIEKIGVFHEQRGMQPLMGRIVGLLMIMEEGEITFEDIVEHLKVSKSAVSNALNLMQLKCIVSYKTKIGERKRYFYLNIKEDWESDMVDKLTDMAKLNTLLEEALEIRGDKNPEFNKNIRNLHDFLEYFKTQMPIFLENFKKLKNCK
jgi:DNA-binding transcriptional regulator GbsR (MarR family)